MSYWEECGRRREVVSFGVLLQELQLRTVRVIVIVRDISVVILVIREVLLASVGGVLWSASAASFGEICWCEGPSALLSVRWSLQFEEYGPFRGMMLFELVVAVP